MHISHPVDDENVKPIARTSANFHGVGVKRATKFPPYVFSVRGASALVHKVLYVQVYWWRLGDGGHWWVKQKRPALLATTACGTSFRLEGECSRTCHVPNPDALLCGRCHGEGATFPKRAGGRDYKRGLTRTEAHVKLGCVVQGY